jgi:Na+/H+-dicarboxylate symporter
MLLAIVPDNVVKAAAENTILAVMFFALMLGIGLVLTRTPATETCCAASRACSRCR